MFLGGHGFFNSSQLRFEDAERLGHLFRPTGGPHIDKFDTLVPENRRLSIRELVEACEKAMQLIKLITFSSRPV